MPTEDDDEKKKARREARKARAATHQQHQRKKRNNSSSDGGSTTEPVSPGVVHVAGADNSSSSSKKEKQSRSARGRAVNEKRRASATTSRDQPLELVPDSDIHNSSPILGMDSSEKKKYSGKGKQHAKKDQNKKRSKSPLAGGAPIPRDGEDEDDELSLQDLLMHMDSTSNTRTRGGDSLYYASVGDVPSEAPGAYRVGDEEEVDDESEYFAPTIDPTVNTTGAIQGFVNDDDDDDIEEPPVNNNIPLATVQRSSIIVRNEKEKAKKKKCLLLVGLLVLLVVAVGAGVGVSVGSNNGNNKSSSPATSPTPTISPSQAPSISLQPTIGGGEWVQGGPDIDGLASKDGYGQWVRLSGDSSTMGISSTSFDKPQAYVQMHHRENSQRANWTTMGSVLYQPVSSIVELSHDGSRMIIGTSASETSRAGVVQAFEWNGSDWDTFGGAITHENTNVQKLTTFGTYASISGNGAVVAVTDFEADAVADDGVSVVEEAGSLHVFRHDGTSWMPLGQVIYGKGAIDNLGWSVSLNFDGSVVAVGAIEEHSNTADDRFLYPGYVQIYELNDDDDEWVQRGSDLGPSRIDDKSVDFGSDVKLSADGNVIVASDNFYTLDQQLRHGSVEVYEYDGAIWKQRGETMIGEVHDVAGFSVDISGDGSIVAYGAPRFEAEGVAGYAKVVYWAQGQWFDLGSRIESESVGGRNLGYSVSLSADGREMAVGDPYNSGANGPDAGSAQFYQFVRINNETGF